MNKPILIGLALLSAAAMATVALVNVKRLGRQPDGRFLLSTQQTISAGTIAFAGRPSDFARNPKSNLFAVTLRDQPSDRREVFLVNNTGVISGSTAALKHAPGYHGMVWSPDGATLYISTGEQADDNVKPRTDGVIEVFKLENNRLIPQEPIVIAEPGEPTNPVPGSLAINKTGTKLFVPATDLNAVVEIDLKTKKRLRKIACGMLPFAARLSEDESTLIVSNWGGRVPTSKDRTSKTGISQIVVDSRGVASSGTITLVDLKTESAKSIPVGIHPSDILVHRGQAIVANSMSDSVSIIDLNNPNQRVTIPLTFKGFKILGSMPVALAALGDTLYVCNGGDNAVAEVDLKTRTVRGYRPAGFFPIAIDVSGSTAWVLNSKGNGSVAGLGHGAKSGNVHEFEGTISLLDLSKDLKTETQRVATNNNWDKPIVRPDLPVYQGQIKHVLYIIKENRTYDEVFGDMPEGNGDPSLAILGKEICPNHQAIAREFTLFDNGYVTGTNSGDGHAWSTQALANDYVEHFYVGYSRTYNDDGNCAMSLASTGAIWDAALAKGLSVRNFGEFCYAALAKYKPRAPKDWFEAWEDRESGKKQFTYEPVTLVPSLKPITNPRVHYWPLLQSDQSRADEFIREYTERSQANTVPNLTILSLPNDHTEGLDPNFPSPRSMVADNDLALGRVVDAVSHSPQWKNTCIFVIEDDAQNGPDHVDGHRSVYMVISPYNKRKTVDSSLQTTVSMIRSMEMMLGIPPMNRFDALVEPITTCFQSKPDLTPYEVRPNRIRLDEPNPGRKKTAMSRQDAHWTKVTQSLDWSHPDGPDSRLLNQVIWYSLKGDAPYPAPRASSLNARKDDDD